MIARFISVSNVATMPAISGLFFVDVCLRAVYLRDKYVVAFFGSCLLALLGIFIYDAFTIN